jgi:hypothetical protein
MLLSPAARRCYSWPAAAPEELQCLKSGHVGTVPGVLPRPLFNGSRHVSSASSCRHHNGCRCRRSSSRIAALPPTPPSADSPDLQQVWRLVQHVWQDLLDAAGSQPPSDASAALALQRTGALAQQTLLMLYLLRSSCNAAQMLAVAAPAADVQQQADLATSAALQSPMAMAGGARHTSSSSTGSSKSSKGGAVRPPGATAQAVAGQPESDGSGGGSGGSGKVTKARRPDIGTLWGLLVLGLAYVHHSTTGGHC